MADFRLRQECFPWEGKEYWLCCNFNVLAECEAEAGSMSAFLRLGTMKGCLIALAAMMNDYAESRDWPERFSARSLGRSLSTNGAEIGKITDLVMGLVLDAIRAPAGGGEELKN